MVDLVGYGGRPDSTGTGSIRPCSKYVALLLAIFCALVLHERIYGDFERLRFPIFRSQQTPSLGAVTVRLPDLSLLSQQPLAIILRLSNNDSVSQVLQVTTSDTTLADVLLEPGQQVRVDLNLRDGTALSAGDKLTVTGNTDGWSLNSLEIANIHGFSTGLVEFVIVPASTEIPNHFGALAALALLTVLIALPKFSIGDIRNTVTRTAYIVLAPIVVLFLTVILVAPWLSNYSVLLADHSFLLCVAILYYPLLDAPLVTIRRLLPTLQESWTYVWSHRVPLLYAAALILFATSISNFYDSTTGLTTLIRFGETVEQPRLPSVRTTPHHVVQDSVGYDGQFYAQLAVEPLLLDPAINVALDNPAYRARRILFSWTAFLFGFGQPALILQAYAIQNIVFWFVLALLLTRWFPPQNLQNFSLWFGCLFSHGALFSVMSAVPDGPSMLLLALTVIAIERGRSNRAAGLIGLAGLAKDINLLWSTILIDTRSTNRRGWLLLGPRLILVVTPLAVWMLYLFYADLEFRDAAGFRNFSAPFTGYVALWDTTLSELAKDGWDSYGRFNLFLLVSVSTQTIVLIWVRAWGDPWWRTGMASCVLMVFLGSAVWEGHPSAATRVLLPMTFAFNAVLPRNNWFWLLFGLGNLTALHGLEVLRVPFWYLL